ncbi:hypothetical protein OAG53_01805 [Akkermansiaceae bacterium]|nr:hypothetical protein [Akkermansiaceae bacterium]
MRTTVFLLLFFLIFGSALAQEEAQHKEPVAAKLATLEELGKALGSDDFEERNTAGKAIWQWGESALDFLQKLESSRDPELAARAANLRYQIRCGILPDTPPEIVKILNGYLNADATARERIARELEEGEHFEYILRLHALEEDGDTKKILREIVNESIPTLIKKYLVENNMSEVRKLLSFADDFDGKIQHASFLQHQGELDQEIARLKEFQDPDSVSRYLACLRVKGDLPLIQSEATRLGDFQLAGRAAVLMGDPVPLYQERLKSHELEAAQKIVLKLLIARAEGDYEREQKLAASLEKIAQSKREPVEREIARNSLYIAGLTEALHRLNDENEFEEAYEFYATFDLDEKIPKLLGLPGNQLSQKWLKGKLAELMGALLRDDLASEPESRLQSACFFFENRGDYEAVSTIIKGVFETYRTSGKGSIQELSSYYIDVFPNGSLGAIAHEIDHFKLSFGEVVRNHHSRYGSSFLWLWSQAKEIDPEISTLESLRLLNAYTGASTMSREEFGKWNEVLLQRVKDAKPEVKERECARLNGLWTSFGPASAKWELYNIPEYGENRFIEAAWLGTRLGRYDEALELLKSGDPESAVYQNGLILYQKALLEAKNGKADESLKTMLKAELFGGGTANFCRACSIYQSVYGHEKEAYEELIKTVLRSSEDFPYLSNIMSSLFQRAITLEKWDQASALAGVYHLQPSRFNSTRYLVKAFEYKFATAMSLLKKGKREEAVSLLEEAHSMIPANGSLADYFLPVLRAHGLKALHDRLCQKTLGLIRRKIEIYPSDHAAKNTFAWIASRANRNLDEAEKMITEALEVDQLSPALMDTYAEVKFAQGKRDEAIQWSERAVDFDISEPQIHEQLRRFKTGAFPTP